jgi:hypothetical protein
MCAGQDFLGLFLENALIGDGVAEISERIGDEKDVRL